MEFPGIICNLKTKSLIKKDSNYYLKFNESDLVKIKERDYAHLEHFINMHKLKEENYLFGSRKRNLNKPTSVSWANRVFKEHLLELGLNKEGLSLQSLRKSRILHLWQDGYTIEEILNEIGDPDKHRHVYRQRRRKLLRDFNLL